MKKVNALVLVGVVLLAAGCLSNKTQTKETDIQALPKQVLTGLQISNGSSLYFRNYFYDNASRLTEIQIKVFDILYTRTKIDTTLLGTDIEKLVYNANGQLASRIKPVSGYHPDSVFERKDFEYNADNLVSKMVYTTKRNAPANSHTELFEYNPDKTLRKRSMLNDAGLVIAYTIYSYPESNTIKVEAYSGVQGPARLVQTHLLTFDTHKCPNPLDRYPEGFLSDLPELPLSKHNLISHSIRNEYGEQEYSFDYTYNEAGYPLECTEAPNPMKVTYFYK